MAIIEDWKRDTLYRMFSHRTYRKEKENYIINAVWQQLNDLELEPVTQQCIHFNDGSHALIDLYFPQVNIGIECDEEYHKANKLNDIAREMKIEDILASVNETNDFLLYRVDATQTIIDIHNQIRTIVDEIRARKDKLIDSDAFVPWQSYEERVACVLTRGEITVQDMIPFPTEAATGPLFNRNPRIWKQAFFRLNDEYMLWFPKLSVEVGGELQSQSSGWINKLSSDWEQIIEYKDGEKNIRAISERELKKRVTFAQSKDKYGHKAYRFIGVFEPYPDNGERVERAYKRVNTKLDLTQFK